MKRIKYIALLFFVTIFKLSAKVNVIYDSSHLQPKNLPNKPSEVYTEKDFIYEAPIQEPNLFSRFLSFISKKIIDFLNQFFNFNLRAETLSGRKIIWIISFILLGVLIILGILFFYKKFKTVIGRNDKNKISVEEVEKNINSVDFDLLIANAVNEQNYRLAIRFYYLKILKTLSVQKLINYEYQKTNYEYFYEINNPDLKNLFKDISFVFDYCWYGDHIAKQSDFSLAEIKFKKIQQLISKL